MITVSFYDKYNGANKNCPIFLLTYSNLYVIITVVLNKRKENIMAHDETKANELYNSMVDKVYSLSLDQLIELQDLVNGAIDNLQMEKMIDLQEKAINALNDYYEAGGSLCSSLENFYIDESQEYDNDFYHIHLK